MRQFLTENLQYSTQDNCTADETTDREYLPGSIFIAQIFFTTVNQSIQ